MSDPLSIQPLVDAALATVKIHELDRTAAYCRWLWQDQKQSRELGMNEYGCADAANILYTLGVFPREPEERACWVAVLRSLQEPNTGMYLEATHHPVHTTAHCLAALELFDARPLHPLTEFDQYASPAAMATFLDGLDWTKNPWSQSHQGAGLYAAWANAGAVPPGFEDAYFAWLWDEVDEATGFWRKGCIDVEDGAPLFHHLAGSFHYLFNHEYARRPLRYPEEMINTCLTIRAEKLHASLGRAIGFAEIDWVFCLNRASRQTAHRFDETRATLRDFAAEYVDYLNGLDHETHDGWNDLHMLFGALCCLAELQQALPGMLRAEKPLKLVLDRRPFI